MATVPPEVFRWRVNEIAQLCGVSLKTAKRWKTGQAVPPPAAIMLLSKDLGCFHPAWKGWRIGHSGTLVSPENWIVTPGDVLGIQLTRLQLGDFRRDVQRLKARINELEIPEEQPLPHQWDIATG